jgi:competence protein ComEA
MTAVRFNRFWMLITLLLVVIIAISSALAWSGYTRGHPVEITLSPGSELQGEIYLGGAVNNPGLYPLAAGDSLDDLIQAAGGTTSNADLSRLKLYIPESGKESEPQKIDINRAEAWLLDALPGIGEARAEAIVNYRRQNGAFKNTSELMKVEGISTAIYERIKELITVAD